MVVNGLRTLALQEGIMAAPGWADGRTRAHSGWCLVFEQIG